MPIYILYFWTSFLGCRNHCKCADGSHELDAGGKPVNADGYCFFYCSPGGFCGDGEAFIEHNMDHGTDCSACNIDNEGSISDYDLYSFSVLW